MSVSTMGRDTDPEVDPNDKSIFDWVKESNLKMVKLCLAEMSAEQCNEKDETGLGLIHWAADRGSSEIVQFLVERGAHVNLRDDDQQTALHYACSCGKYSGFALSKLFGLREPHLLIHYLNKFIRTIWRTRPPPFV